MGAYSELDAALREDGGDFVDDQDFLEDEAFLEDDQPSGPAPDSAGGASAAETASVPAGVEALCSLLLGRTS